MKGAMECINCDRLVYLDEKGNPLSKYWINTPSKNPVILHALCGPQCATEYKEKIDSETD